MGIPHCPQCGKVISQQSLDQIVDKVLSLPEGSRVQILAPVVRRKKGEHQKIFENARKSGYVRVRVDGIIYDLSEEIELEKQKKHNVEIVVDRLVVRPDIRTRLADSVEIALHQADGIVMILNGEEEMTFSRNYACEDCGISLSVTSFPLWRGLFQSADGVLRTKTEAWQMPCSVGLPKSIISALMFP